MVSEILIKTSNLAFNWQFYRECPKVSIIDMNPTITNPGLQPHQPRNQCVQLVFRVARLSLNTTLSCATCIYTQTRVDRLGELNFLLVRFCCKLCISLLFCFFDNFVTTNVTEKYIICFLQYQYIFRVTFFLRSSIQQYEFHF